LGARSEHVEKRVTGRSPAARQPTGRVSPPLRHGAWRHEPLSTCGALRPDRQYTRLSAKRWVSPAEPAGTGRDSKIGVGIAGVEIPPRRDLLPGQNQADASLSFRFPQDSEPERLGQRDTGRPEKNTSGDRTAEIFSKRKLPENSKGKITSQNDGRTNPNLYRRTTRRAAAHPRAADRTAIERPSICRDRHRAADTCVGETSA